jgi:hypothetical protein
VPFCSSSWIWSCVSMCLGPSYLSMHLSVALFVHLFKHHSGCLFPYLCVRIFMCLWMLLIVWLTARDIVSADLWQFPAHVSLHACACPREYFLSLHACCSKSLVQSPFEWACVSQHVYAYICAHVYDCRGLFMSLHIAA